jgi:RNase H-fold protein (predicted Holliday junction resolvase)
MLSMRQSRRGDVEFYSADERLTSEETRQVLLEPLLFPRQSSAA